MEGELICRPCRRGRCDMCEDATCACPQCSDVDDGDADD